MRYYYYPSHDNVLQSDSAIAPRFNGEEGNEITYSEYNAHVLRINSSVLAQYNAAVENQKKQAADLIARRREVLGRLGVSDDEMELFL